MDKASELSTLIYITGVTTGSFLLNIDHHVKMCISTKFLIYSTLSA
ncbi:hypothetical protein HMPREF1548_02914 [Clostridium sp. KLE 1755]|nr:hypothetical protein HMPREF1548_02914 [Clostridium sp. KLE 1755]